MPIPMPKSIIEDTREYIRLNGLIKKGQTICVAVSGGVDSVVMLRVLSELSEELKLRLIVCHLDHGLRGSESKRDHDFVKKLSKDLGFLFEGEKVPKSKQGRVGESVQVWARGVRLDFLRRMARKHRAASVALAHNLDDQAETVLMRIIKGTSLKGLTAMAPKRGPFIRPLLGVKRARIEEFARMSRLEFVLDSSNLSDKYLRNKIRLKLIPYIERGYNPSVKEALSRTSAVLSADEAFLDAQATRCYDRVATASKAMGKVTLDRRGLLRADKALRARVFIKALSDLLPDTLDVTVAVSSANVESFLSLITSRTPNATIDLPGGVLLQREYDRVVVKKVGKKVGKKAGEKGKLVVKSEGYSMELVIPGTTQAPFYGYEAGHGAGVLLKATILKRKPSGPSLNSSKDVAYFDLDKLKTLTVRSFRAGDRLRPLGLKGKSKKLKDVFIDDKVPLSKRRSLPLIVSDADSEILWIAGLKRSASALVGPETTRILKLMVKGMDSRGK